MLNIQIDSIQSINYQQDIDSKMFTLLVRSIGSYIHPFEQLEPFQIHGSAININKKVSSQYFHEKKIEIQLLEQVKEFDWNIIGSSKINIKKLCLQPGDSIQIPIKSENAYFSRATITFCYQLTPFISDLTETSLPISIKNIGYFIFNISSPNDHEISFIHISSNSQLAEVSDSSNLFIQNASMSKISNNFTSIMFSSSSLSLNWPSIYFLCSTKNPNNPIHLTIYSIIPSSDSNIPFLFNAIASIELNLPDCSFINFGSFLYSQESDSFSFESNMKQFNYPLIREYLPEIVKDLEIKPKFTPRRLSQLNDFPIEFNDEPISLIYSPIIPKNVIRIKMHSKNPKKQVDLSLILLHQNKKCDFVSKNGSQRRDQSVNIGTDMNGIYENIMEINFNKLKNDVSKVIIGLTQFNKSIPISKCLPIVIAFTTASDYEFAKFIVSPQKAKPGLIFGIFSKGPEGWTFHYHNHSCKSCSCYTMAPKVLNYLNSGRDDIEWKDNSVLNNVDVLY